MIGLFVKPTYNPYPRTKKNSHLFIASVQKTN